MTSAIKVENGWRWLELCGNTVPTLAVPNSRHKLSHRSRGYKSETELSTELVSSGEHWYSVDCRWHSPCHFTQSSLLCVWVCVSDSVATFLLSIRTQSHSLKAHSHDLVLTWSSVKTLFPNKSTFTGTTGEASNVWGAQFKLSHRDVIYIHYSTKVFQK